MGIIFWIFIVPAIAAVAGDRLARHTDNFRHYYDSDEIEHYLEHLTEEHPDLVSIESIGTTSEGREITAVHVGLKEAANETAKPMIVVESGLHPREWIGIMVNLYFIHMFTEHPDHQELLKKVDLLFVPVANPDGFLYTHTTDRNWNKNRRVVSENCTGVDLNRNFDFQFKASGNNCKQSYSGPTAASEAETQAIQELIKKHQAQIKLYLSLQAFGTQILTPYNYADVSFAQQESLKKLAKKVAKAIESVNHRSYRVGTGAALLRAPESGTSSDYAFGSAKIPAAFTIKLPRGGAKAFEVPATQLDRILSESFVGFLTAVKAAIKIINIG